MAHPGSAPGITLACRLPVYTGGQSLHNTVVSGSGGFIVYPGGTFVADPRSAVTLPGGGVAEALTYDAAYSKWLPISGNWVSPDGAHYAYPLNDNVYVQSVADGTQIVLGAGQKYFVLSVENDGVYVTHPPGWAYGADQPGLWFLPFSGAARQISATGYWQAESHDAAYSTPKSVVGGEAIQKLDMSTGTTSDYFTLQGELLVGLYVIGFDIQGHPLIVAGYFHGEARLYIATAPNVSTYIAATPFLGSTSVFPHGPAVADSHGLWFTLVSVGGNSWSAALPPSQTGTGIVMYSNNTWHWMSNLEVQLAGACT